MQLNDKTYNVLKYIALIALPALAACFGTIATAVGFQYTEIVITVITAIDTLLGTLLGVSTNQYNKKQ